VTRAKLFGGVPFARSGPQPYLANEIGAEGRGVVTVDRPEAEVAASAPTFEGVPVTIDHPSDLVTADNLERYAVGMASNVRFVDGYLRGDLLLWDAQAIKMVAGGLRELSAGYTAEYQRDGNGYQQRNIRGNHVALVPAGRAGSAARIGG